MIYTVHVYICTNWNQPVRILAQKYLAFLRKWWYLQDTNGSTHTVGLHVISVMILGQLCNDPFYHRCAIIIKILEPLVSCKYQHFLRNTICFWAYYIHIYELQPVSANSTAHSLKNSLHFCENYGTCIYIWYIPYMYIYVRIGTNHWEF